MHFWDNYYTLPCWSTVLLHIAKLTDKLRLLSNRGVISILLSVPTFFETLHGQKTIKGRCSRSFCLGCYTNGALNSACLAQMLQKGGRRDPRYGPVWATS